MTRRQFMMGALLSLAQVQPGWAGLPEVSAATRQQAFVSWVTRLQPPQAQGLAGYMDGGVSGQGTLSSTASADLLLLFLRLGRIDLAEAVGDGLVIWHRRVSRTAPKVVAGGMPSEFLPQGGSWVAGSHYYASDNLVVMAALLELYAATRNAPYADTAVRIGAWMESTLFDGKRLGTWSQNYGPAMQYMREDGAVNDEIHAGMDFLWLSALQPLHQLDPGRGWNERLTQAVHFFAGAQSPTGGWHDHFKPAGRDRSQGGWRGFRNADVMLGDNSLRSALAAHQFGLKQQTERFAAWLRPVQDCWMYGYLDPQNAGPKFVASDTPYYDVVCTGLLRAWYRKTGLQQHADQCQAALDALQAPNGGWYWAATASNLSPLNREQALVTGCWALADLCHA
jgi:hypothetical protein